MTRYKDLPLNGNITADPKFSSLSDFDFTLADSSPAFALGFSPVSESIAKK